MALTLRPQFLRIGTLGRGARSTRRPFGVYIIALLQAFNAIAYAAGVFTDFQAPVTTLGPADAPDIVAALMLGAGLLVALGLLLLKRWAWVATMLWVGAAMAAELYLYLRGEDTNYVVMLVSVAQVFYLNLSDVQACFGGRPETGTPRNE
jgi:hypothetical protein